MGAAKHFPQINAYVLLDPESKLGEGTAGGMPGLVIYFMDLQIVTRVNLSNIPDDILDDKIQLFNSPNGGFILSVFSTHDLHLFWLKFQPGDRLISDHLLDPITFQENLNSVILTKFSFESL